MIVEPVTLQPHNRVGDALDLMKHYHISGVPITDGGGKLVGILTNRDLRFADDVEQPIANLMTTDQSDHRAGRHDPRSRPRIFSIGNKIEKLPVVDNEGCLKGLITVKDIQKRIQFPNATKDARKGGCGSRRGSAPGHTNSTGRRR